MSPAELARHEGVLSRERDRRLKENGPCVLIDPRVLVDPVGRCNWCGEEIPRLKSGLVSATRRWCAGEVPFPDVPGRVEGWTTTHAFLWAYQHSWTSARGLALLRSGGRCDQCGAVPEDVQAARGGRYLDVRDQLEVNHVEPRNGAGYDLGCWNHQTNLQVLCHPCHVAETTRQVRDRIEERLLARAEELGVDPATLRAGRAARARMRGEPMDLWAGVDQGG